jgi:hypothetical protein
VPIFQRHAAGIFCGVMFKRLKPALRSAEIDRALMRLRTVAGQKRRRGHVSVGIRTRACPVRAARNLMG